MSLPETVADTDILEIKEEEVVGEIKLAVYLKLDEERRATISKICLSNGSLMLYSQRELQKCSGGARAWCYRGSEVRGGPLSERFFVQRTRHRCEDHLELD